MYAKYHTDALVLGSSHHGEADKRVILYTREFGLVHTRASAVRTESSRMRYALQYLSRTRVSLVRGATGWRVAGAQALGTAPSLRTAPALARIAQLVVRLVGGEEKNEHLFLVLSEAHSAFANAEKTAAIELACVARVLHALGYLSSEALGSALCEALYEPHVLESVEVNQSTILKFVNRALAETQL